MDAKNTEEGESRSPCGTPVGAQVFECKTCDRKFSTFQALGGHCTGHKRQRQSPLPPAEAKKKKKEEVHRCLVCGAGFAMGQALGGHMRRHRKVEEEEGLDQIPVGVCLDLKLSPPCFH